MDRLTQKNDLLIKLGMLFRPLVLLAEKPEDYDAQERAQMIAQYGAEWQLLTREFHSFTEGQPGHSYTVEYYQFQNALQDIISSLINGYVTPTSTRFSSLVTTQLSKARNAIDAIQYLETRRY